MLGSVLDINEHLPEISLLVLLALPPEAILALSTACRRRCALCRSDQLWMELFARDWNFDFGSAMSEFTSWRAAYIREASCRFEAPKTHDRGNGIRYDTRWRVAVVGDPGTGKTSFVSRFLRGTWSSTPPPKNELSLRAVGLHGVTHMLHLMDPTFRPGHAPTWYRACRGALVTFSIADRATLASIPRYMADVRKHQSADLYPFIVGLKSDLGGPATRQVSPAEGAACARSHGCPYGECSALTGYGVERLMVRAVWGMYRSEDSYPVLPCATWDIADARRCCVM